MTRSLEKAARLHLNMKSISTHVMTKARALHVNANIYRTAKICSGTSTALEQQKRWNRFFSLWRERISSREINACTTHD